MRAAEILAREGIEVEIVDPRSLVPLDRDVIRTSVRKTGRLIVADTGWKNCGFSAEIAALAAEDCFAELRAPVRRVCLADVPMPTSCAKPLYIG